MTFLRLRKVAVKTMVMIAMTLNSSSTRVEGFVTLGGRTREAMSMTSASPVPKHIVILPDSRAAMNDSDLWHHHLKTKLLRDVKGEWDVSIEDMPDPFSFNTKRYEVFWLQIMADELDLSPETLVVAHGTAADALLRFAEKHEVWGAVLVCPGGELYHAGERHGRPYVWPRVRRGCPRLAIVVADGDPVVATDEALRVKTNLGVEDSLYREVSGGQHRLRDRTGHLPAAEDLVAALLTLS